MVYDYYELQRTVLPLLLAISLIRCNIRQLQIYKITFMAFFYRCYHFALKCIVIFIGIPNPRLYTGYSGLAQWLKTWQTEKPLLVVSDATLLKLGVLKKILVLLDEQQIKWHLYTDVAPNPSIDNVENGVQVYKAQQCAGIIAIGGGSIKKLQAHSINILLINKQ